MTVVELMHHKFSWELAPGIAADGLESPGSGDGLHSAGSAAEPEDPRL